MKLEAYITQSIMRWPMLYYATTYEESRMRILDHAFLVIGNGMFWTEDGYLASKEKKTPRPYGKDTFRKLPKGFFDKHLILVSRLTKESAKSMVKFFRSKGVFAYSILNKRYAGSGVNNAIVFEASDQGVRYSFQKTTVEILNRVHPGSGDFFAPEFTESELEGAMDLRQSRFSSMEGRDYPWSPYPIYDSSPIFAIFEGKVTPAPDWLAGAVEIAKAALAYWSTPERWAGPRMRPDNESVVRRVEENVNFYRKFLEKYDAGQAPVV